MEGLGTTWGLRGARDSPSPGDRWVSWPESGAKSLGLDQSGLDLPQGLGQGTSTTSKARTYQPGQPMAARWGSGQPGRPPADTPWSISQPSLAGRTRPFHMLAEPATPSAKNRDRVRRGGRCPRPRGGSLVHCLVHSCSPSGNIFGRREELGAALPWGNAQPAG